MLAELSEAEIDRARDRHPRIGARPDTAASAREQAGADDAVRIGLVEGNLAHGEKFGPYLSGVRDR